MGLGRQDIFTKVNLDETDRLLNELSTEKAILSCKVEALDDIFSFRIKQRVKNTFRLSGFILEKITLPTTMNFEAIISAKIGQNRYYLTGTLRKEPDGIYSLEISTNVFQLQRRQHYRVTIPESYGAKFQVEKLNDKSNSLNFVVHDMSAGGCRLRLETSHPNISANDVISGTFEMLNKTPLQAKGQVKHVKTEKLNGTDQQFLGIQFIEVTPAFEKRLVSLVMELHRQFFTNRIE